MRKWNHSKGMWHCSNSIHRNWNRKFPVLLSATWCSSWRITTCLAFHSPWRRARRTLNSLCSSVHCTTGHKCRAPIFNIVCKIFYHELCRDYRIIDYQTFSYGILGLEIYLCCPNFFVVLHWILGYKKNFH